MIIDLIEYSCEQYLIACFDQTLILFKENEFHMMNNLLNQDNKSDIIILKEEITDIITKIDQNQHFNFLLADQNFHDDIITFTKQFKILNPSILLFWKQIRNSFFGFLIQKSYKNSIINHNQNFEQLLEEEKEQVQLNKSNFITMKQFFGGISSINMIYHIEEQKFFILKTFFNQEKEKLKTREQLNYLNVHHPFLLKCFGSTRMESNEILILEYFKGTTLNEIKDMNLEMKDKIDIILKIIIVLDYLHRNQYIYRDLKPNNIMIDDNKAVVLIDLDRMIKNDDKNVENQTALSSIFISPELASGFDFSYSTDIYSLGAVIYFIIYGEHATEMLIEKQLRANSDQKLYFELCKIIQKCMNSNPEKRPKTAELIDFFLCIYVNEYCKSLEEEEEEERSFDFENNYALEYYLELISETNDPKLQNDLGKIYEEGQYVIQDIDKAIHYYTLAADQNFSEAQFNLGVIYEEGQYVIQDIDKAIHYYTLAADQNFSEAQFNLGVIYDEGEYVKRDIKKAIHYYTLAADQNDADAQYNLGLLYGKGKLVKRDISKAIHYYTLAAKQNCLKAQFNLGLFYEEGELVARDINKAIYYYSLAAEQHDEDALINLAIIYEKGEFISRDIQKAIHYYTLAANQNCTQAQLNLGVIYSAGKYISPDISKAIHYYTLASEQKDSDAQYNLGLIYISGNYVKQDIDKAIHYFTLSSKQNNPEAHFNLGMIFMEGKYVQRDINKAIHYFKLAAKQNIPEAHLALGNIYIDGVSTEIDIKKAIYYYSEAAKYNFPEAQYELGNIYASRDINNAILYYSLAAEQNHPKALFELGFIYSTGQYVKRDYDKAIHYFQLAAKQNVVVAIFNLGIIYFDENSDKYDVDKGYHYYLLAADKNDPFAMYNLGFIHSTDKYGMLDINKAIHYYTLASKHNVSQAQYNLGVIYLNGIYVKKDIKKAIHYFTLATHQHYPDAQYLLGTIYEEGEYIAKDINKAIHYYALAANQNNSNAQFDLGLIYYLGDENVHQDIKKGQYYIILASKNGNRNANFAHGFLLHEGKSIKSNIKEAIHFYKEASTFNNQYAKNNLGIIYKNGYGNEIEKNTANAIVYFEEAIRQKNDILSMYNLAHIYMYDETIKQDINKSIELLIKSSHEFGHSLILLCIAFVHYFGFNFEKVEHETVKYLGLNNNLLSSISKKMVELKLNDKKTFYYLHESYRKKDFLYNIQKKYILTSDILRKNFEETTPKYYYIRDISSEFYDGFGIALD
ncbi:hypothetical protein M9Y10_001631 [Tritrichomonas musculus]|uniref:Protein kinase domain-containing protein n=1 Tax=Tritrichomonas musculus TaxID=1915356 RepID=A0ABR2L7L2_9EUKA